MHQSVQLETSKTQWLNIPSLLWLLHIGYPKNPEENRMTSASKLFIFLLSLKSTNVFKAIQNIIRWNSIGEHDEFNIIWA